MAKHQDNRRDSREKIVKEYKEADKYIVINDDPDLEAIYIPTPKPPPLHLIEGYGKKPEEQIWKPPWIPRKLLELQKFNLGLTIDQIWEELESDQEKYKEEIEYIKKMWYHRLKGYWFFNNGKPTYITGKHFFYMTSYKIDVGLPKYRYRDRMYWIAIDFIRNHTLDFVNKDDEGNAKKTMYPDGKEYYEMKDLHRRVFYGDAYPKMRREGATYRGECNNLETISKLRNAQGGIQSRNDPDAKKVFVDKLIKPFKRVPFFFKPTYAGSTDPKSELSFDVPSVRVGGKGAAASVGGGLESMIDFSVGDEGAYDGLKLYFHHDDESGKNKDNDVMQRHIVVMECLAQGVDIHGYATKTSTVGEMEKGGGRVFKEICDLSNFYQRTEIGQTTSGLVILFMSSIYGLPGTIDKHGDSDTEAAEVIIMSKRNALRRAGKIERYIEKVRQYPIRYRECFMSSSNDMGFNLLILADRIGELRINRPDLVRGEFVRDDPRDRTSKVNFVENPQGNFVMSRQMFEFQSNNIYMAPAGYAPYKAGKFNVGVDPFAFDETEGGQMSDGGIAVKWKRDFLIDPPEKSQKECITDRFVCTYQHRGVMTTDDFADKVLMCAMYFSAMVLTESNVQVFVKEFKRWGMGGFLKHMRDPATGKFRNTPGYPTTGSGRSKQNIFNALRDYIQRRGKWEHHLELLEDCNDIQGIKEMTKYDRLTAAGIAELAEDSDHGDTKKGEETKKGFDLPARMRSMD